MSVLVDAYNRCWLPHFPGEAPATVPDFKRLVRDVDLWCSSSMVAYEGREPVAVLWGAKRTTETLVYRIATTPGYERRGHARHLLTSLSSKLAILGPSRIVAEVPEENTSACALFDACGYTHEVTLVDWVLEVERWKPVEAQEHRDWLLIPITVEDLAANGLLDAAPPSRCWQRVDEAIRRRADQLDGLAVASQQRIEAFVLHRRSPDGGHDLIALQCQSGVRSTEAFGFLLTRLLEISSARVLRIAKVHPDEALRPCLDAGGFQERGSHRRYVTAARAA